MKSCDFRKSLISSKLLTKKLDNSRLGSRMEGGEKPVSDKLLNKIEDVFEINLDDYKKYDHNKRGLYLQKEAEETNHAPNGQNDDTTNEHEHSPEHATLKSRYLQLLEKKSQIDESYYALREEHRRTTQELDIVNENNRLLKELVADMKEVLKRVGSLPNETIV